MSGKLSTYPDLDTTALDGTERVTGWRSTAPKNFNVPLGLVPISSGHITTPVEYLDITLPSGYSLFKLFVANFVNDNQDALSLGFSFDDGSSFICDLGNSDSYLFNETGSGLGSPGATGHLSSQAADWFDAEIMIFPGVGSSPPRWYAEGIGGFNGPPADIGRSIVIGSLNPSATVAPPSGRATTLRLIPDNGALNPPTSGDLITSGIFALFGVPSA